MDDVGAWEQRMTDRSRMRTQLGELLEPTCEGHSGFQVMDATDGTALDRCGRCGRPLGGEDWRP